MPPLALMLAKYEAAPAKVFVAGAGDHAAERHHLADHDLAGRLGRAELRGSVQWRSATTHKGNEPTHDPERMASLLVGASQSRWARAAIAQPREVHSVMLCTDAGVFAQKCWRSGAGPAPRPRTSTSSTSRGRHRCSHIFRRVWRSIEDWPSVWWSSASCGALAFQKLLLVRRIDLVDDGIVQLAHRDHLLRAQRECTHDCSPDCSSTEKSLPRTWLRTSTYLSAGPKRSSRRLSRSTESLPVSITCPVVDGRAHLVDQVEHAGVVHPAHQGIDASGRRGPPGCGLLRLVDRGLDDGVERLVAVDHHR